MAELEDLELVPEEIQAEDAKKTPDGSYLYPDAQALQLVLDDLDHCDSWANINLFASNWMLSDTLLQSPQNANMLVSGSKSNIPVFTLSNHLSAIVPKCMSGLFYENPPFLLRPRQGTTQDLVRAKTAVFTAQLDDMEFEEQCEQLLEQMALLGTCIAKYGWMEKTEKIKTFKPKAQPETLKSDTGVESEVHTEDSDEFEIEYVEKKTARPWLKFVDIRTVRVDPGCRVGDIRKAKYVLHTEYPSYLDLEDLRQQMDYDIPTETELRAFFDRDEENTTQQGDSLALTMPENMRGWLQHAMPRNQRTTADPLETPLMIIERQDAHSIIVVLVHGTDYILIRNSENPAKATSYLSANWRNIPDAFYGQGLGTLIGMEQITEQGLKSLAIDLIGYGLHPQLVRKKGFNTPTQNIIWRQGGIIDVDEDVDKALSVLEMPQPPSSAWQFLSVTKAQASETSGANQQTMMGATSPGGSATGMRSGTGAAAVTSATASRLDGPIERFIRQVFIPFLRIMDELDNEFLPSSILRMVLDEAGLAEMKTDHIKFRNAKLEYECLAGAHLGPKKEMSQFMTMLLQIVNNPTLTQAASDQGLAFNFEQFFKAFADLAGWKYSQSFFTKMTDDQQKRHDANAPAAIAGARAQAAQQSQQAQFEHDQQLENAKEMGRAANQVLRTTLEHATNAELQGMGGSDIEGQ